MFFLMLGNSEVLKICNLKKQKAFKINYFTKNSETYVQASSCKFMSVRHFWALLESGSNVVTGIYRKKYL